MQTHTPTVVQGGVGGWNLPPRVFVTLQYFEKFLPLIDSVYVVYKMMLILWDTYANGAAGGQ